MLRQRPPTSKIGSMGPKTLAVLPVTNLSRDEPNLGTRWNPLVEPVLGIRSFTRSDKSVEREKIGNWSCLALSDFH